MGTLTLLERAARVGLRPERFGHDRLRVHGPQSAQPEALELGQHKEDVLEALFLFEERAALMEYEGGLSRDEAEAQARAALRQMLHQSHENSPRSGARRVGINLMIALQFTDVCFTAGTEAQIESGLLGFVSATINDAIRLEGLALRRTTKGEIRLAFPDRSDRFGVRHRFLAPLNDDIRREIEGQILGALGHREVER